MKKHSKNINPEEVLREQKYSRIQYQFEKKLEREANKAKGREITCLLEKDVADILNELKINFVHEHEKNGVQQRLDFYLPDYDVYIEVKNAYTERVKSQLASQKNVILIQGGGCVKFLAEILKKKLK